MELSTKTKDLEKTKAQAEVLVSGTGLEISCVEAKRRLRWSVARMGEEGPIHYPVTTLDDVRAAVTWFASLDEDAYWSLGGVRDALDHVVYVFREDNEMSLIIGGHLKEMADQIEAEAHRLRALAARLR